MLRLVIPTDALWAGIRGGPERRAESDLPWCPAYMALKPGTSCASISQPCVIGAIGSASVTQTTTIGPRHGRSLSFYPEKYALLALQLATHIVVHDRPCTYISLPRTTGRFREALKFFLLCKPAARHHQRPSSVCRTVDFYRYSSGGSSGSYNLTWIAAAAFRR